MIFLPRGDKWLTMSNLLKSGYLKFEATEKGSVYVMR